MSYLMRRSKRRMFLSSLLLLMTSGGHFGLEVFAAPSTSFTTSDRIGPREANVNGSSQFFELDNADGDSSTAFPLSSEANVTTITNASALIKDSNGVDITSLFQLKVYHPPPPKHITNLTEEDKLHTRGAGVTEVVKVINKCPGENVTFIESHCTPKDDEEAPLQAFVYTCRRIVDHWRAATGEYMGRAPAYRTFHDRCEPDELCVDGFGEKQIASCVHTALFDDYMIGKDGFIKGMLHGEIFDVGKAWSMISKNDKSKPMKAKKFELDAWSSVSGRVKGGVQRKSCSNCVDLETDTLEPQMDSLRLEATLMSAGAVGGILWLALGAG